MFFAINKNTKEKINSIYLEQNSSYQFIKEDEWYADPDYIETLPENIEINKIKVRFREGCIDAISCKGNKYDISPHFYIPNKKKLGINTIPESKEHKQAKNWIYNILKKKKNLFINYAKINKPFPYKEKINILNLPIDLERIGVEAGSSTFGFKKSRRADVICPFIIKHPILGNGIIFEIQFSNQKEKTRLDRELDWALRGYSLVWIFKEDIEEVSNNNLLLKKDSLDVNTFTSLIKKNNQILVKNLRTTTQELSRQLEEKKYEIINEIKEKKLAELNIDRIEIKEIVEDMFDELKNKIQPRCPKCNTLMVLKTNRTNGKKFWGCINYCPGVAMSVMD